MTSMIKILSLQCFNVYGVIFFVKRSDRTLYDIVEYMYMYLYNYIKKQNAYFHNHNMNYCLHRPDIALIYERVISK